MDCGRRASNVGSLDVANLEISLTLRVAPLTSLRSNKQEQKKNSSIIWRFYWRIDSDFYRLRVSLFIHKFTRDLKVVGKKADNDKQSTMIWDMIDCVMCIYKSTLTAFRDSLIQTGIGSC